MNMDEIQEECEKHGLTVVWSEYVTGARVNNRIYLNPNLLNHQAFLKSTLDHEFRHTGKFTWKDFHMDVVEGSVFDTILFSLEYPKSLRRFFPLYYEDKEFQVDVNLIIIYSIMLTLLSFVVYYGWLRYRL